MKQTEAMERAVIQTDILQREYGYSTEQVNLIVCGLDLADGLAALEREAQFLADRQAA